MRERVKSKILEFANAKLLCTFPPNKAIPRLNPVR